MSSSRQTRLRAIVLVAAALVIACGKADLPQPTSSLPPGTKIPSAVTERASRWLGYCQHGGWPWNDFGTGPNDSPKSTALRSAIESGFRNLLDPLGEVLSMKPFAIRKGRTSEGHDRTYYDFYVTAKGGHFDYAFALDADGFVGGVWIKTGTGSFYYSR